jgi:hypothetical protein
MRSAIRARPTRSHRLNHDLNHSVINTHHIDDTKPIQEDYAKPSLKKYKPTAARNEDKKVFSGLL